VKPDRAITDARTAKALAHPLRVRILGVLEERTASPRELALELDADLSQLSYHVRTLHRMGFIELVEQKRRRAALESYYRATERPVVTSEAWAQMPSVVKKELIGGTLGQMSEQVNAAVATGGFERSEAHLSRSPMVLDAEGFSQVADRLDALLAEFEQIAAEAEERLAAVDHEGAVDATAVLLFFENGEPAAATPRAAAGKRRRAARRAATG
jgi:DNA-binding transcriptional ArsR family regulator